MPSATLSTSPVSPASSTALRPPALLTATDCTDQVHLVIGNNALASSRCAKLLEVGATVKLIAPTTEGDGLYHGLVKRVEEGEIEWIRREFVKEDLTTLGREEVDRVVDRVFVTLPVDCAQCKCLAVPIHIFRSCVSFHVVLYVLAYVSLCHRSESMKGRIRDIDVRAHKHDNCSCVPPPVCYDGILR